MQWVLPGREFQRCCTVVRGMPCIESFDVTFCHPLESLANINTISVIGAICRTELEVPLPTAKGYPECYTTGVPKKYVSRPFTLVRRRLTRRWIESKRPKNSYHLHGIASGVNFKQLETPPRSSPGVFSPPTGVGVPRVRFVCGVLCADFFFADLQADPANGTQRAKL